MVPCQALIFPTWKFRQMKRGIWTNVALREGFSLAAFIIHISITAASVLLCLYRFSQVHVVGPAFVAVLSLFRCQLCGARNRGRSADGRRWSWTLIISELRRGKRPRFSILVANHGRRFRWDPGGDIVLLDLYWTRVVRNFVTHILGAFEIFLVSLSLLH